MKKFFALTAALVFLGAGSSFALISGSLHDFAGGPGYTFDTEICAPCHTPHNAVTGAGPLWAHTPTTASYTVYTSATYNGGVITVGGISLACLSCHDGTVALDSYIGGAGTAGTLPAGSSNLDTDLSDDHPISFDQNVSAGLDSDIRLAADAVTASTGALVFYGGGSTLECATCHDVHNGAGFASLLRMDNGGSNLCLACHIK